jgi:hypothetical protein
MIFLSFKMALLNSAGGNVSRLGRVSLLPNGWMGVENTKLLQIVL